jgi:hypothetical protein
MTLKSYIIIMSIMAFVCWLAWGFIIWTVDPVVTNWVGFLLFYLSLFLSLTGTAAIAGFIIRFVAFKQVLAFRLVKEAFRQSFLLAALVVVSLYLLSQNLFTWMNLIFLVLGLSVLEFFLINYETRG